MDTDSPAQRPIWKTVAEWVKVIVIALVIALPVRWYVAEPFVVQGASMDPTFSTGQFLVVDRVSYRLSDPQRGDVIIFQYPNNPDLYYIKRIIGLPGETVNIRDGHVTITNAAHPQGFELKEPYVAADHASLDSGQYPLSSTQYFVMGDNRAQSSDSRAWGPLESHFIVGKPFIRFYPLSLTPGQYHESDPK